MSTKNLAMCLANNDLTLSAKAAMVNAAVKSSSSSYAYGMGPASAAAQAVEGMKRENQQAQARLQQQMLYGGGGALGGAALGAMASRKNRLRNAVIGAALGGGGGLLAQSLMQSAGKTASEKQAFPSMQDLGGYAKNLTSNIPTGVLQGAGMGGLGGGLAGGLAGLMAPGEDVEYDEEGNVIGRKQRSRFGAALRGLLGGGLLGAGAGGAAGYFAPEQTGQAYNAAAGFGSDMAKRLGFGPAAPTNTANPQSQKEIALAAEQGRGGNYAKSYLGSDRDYFGASGQKGEAKRFRDAQTESAPGTMGAGNLGGGPAGVKNPLYQGPNTANMQAPKSPTYTPTDTAGVAARRAQAEAALAAKQERMQKSLMGPQAYANLQAQRAQNAMDQQAGISNVSPEVLAMKQNDPAAFERMLQDARNRFVEENLKTAPSMGFDASGIDMSNMQLPGSATMGR